MYMCVLIQLIIVITGCTHPMLLIIFAFPFLFPLMPLICKILISVLPPKMSFYSPFSFNFVPKRKKEKFFPLPVVKGGELSSPGG